MGALRNFYSKIVFGGTENLKDPFQIASITISNFIAFLAFTVCSLFTVFHLLITKDPIAAFSAFITAPTFLIVIQQNHKGNYRVAMYFMPTSATIGLTAAVVLFGTKAGFQMLILTAFSLYFLILLAAPKKTLWFFWICLLIIFVGIEPNPFHIYDGVFHLSDDILGIFRIWASFIAAFFIMIGCYYSYVLINKSNLQKEDAFMVIAEQKNDIDTMLNSLNQGIFSLVKEGIIDEKYSKKLEDLIGIKNIAGKRFSDIFNDDYGLTSEAQTMIESIIAITLSENTLGFDLNYHKLPKSLVKSGDPKKLFELDWNPIVDKDGLVTKLLISIRDVTEIAAMKTQTEHNRTEVILLEEIFKSDIDSFQANFEQAQVRCQAFTDALAKADIVTEDTIIQILRHIHTLKGEARTIFWSTLSAAAHNTEDELQIIIKQAAPIEPKKEEIAPLLDKLVSVLRKYKDLHDAKLKQSRNKNEKYQKFQNILTILEDKPISDLDSQAFLQFIQSTFNYKPLSEMLQIHIIDIGSLATQLGKPKPAIHLNDNNIVFSSRYERVIKSIFTHLLQNSVDHGIELPSLRSSIGKKEAGTISISVEMRENRVLIKLADDGQGLNLDELKISGQRLGIETSQLSDQAIAELIFHPGLSTKQRVTQISGRGIGMNAVRSYLKDFDCDIQVVLLDSINRGSYVAFALDILMPTDATMMAPATTNIQEILRKSAS